jgi:hypothetical protein
MMMPWNVQDKTASARTSRTLSYSALALVGALTASPLTGIGARAADPQFQNWLLRPVCVLWDGQASEAIARRVNESRDDVDLRQLGDAIFRIRRARRSCEIGLIRMACQDYIAVIRNVYGISSEWPGRASVCPLAIADEQGGDGRQAARQGDDAIPDRIGVVTMDPIERRFEAVRP